MQYQDYPDYHHQTASTPDPLLFAPGHSEPRVQELGSFDATRQPLPVDPAGPVSHHGLSWHCREWGTRVGSGVETQSLGPLASGDNRERTRNKGDQGLRTHVSTVKPILASQMHPHKLDRWSPGN